MPEKSNEELLDAALSDHEHAEWLADGNNNPKREGIDEAREAARKSRAVVLARMCGPGDVVVPKEPTHDMLSAWTFTKDYGEHKTLMRAAYANLLAARPRTRRQR